MENNQSVPQELSNEVTPTPESGTAKSKTGRWDVLIYLLTHYPWLFVVALLAIFIGSATVSVYTLGYVEPKEKEKPETYLAEIETEVIPLANISTETNSNPIPLWMVMAIAGSCAGGCLVIARLLKLRTYYPKAHKFIDRHQRRLVKPQNATLEAHTPVNSPVFVPPPRTHIVPIPPQPSKPKVKVLSAKRQIVTQSKESLADMMDIRKQSTLSSILGKN
jgi:hypothetical protein